MKQFLRVLLILFIGTFSISGGGIDSSWYAESQEFVKNYEAHLTEVKLDQLRNSPLTMANLDSYMELLNVTHREIILKQIILESGWLKSGLTKKYNNLLGMKLPRVRETTAIGQKMGHAEYSHWTDSVDDYILWRDYWESKGFDTQNYYKFLSNVGYAESSNYIATLKKINVSKERIRLC